MLVQNNEIVWLVVSMALLDLLVDVATTHFFMYVYKIVNNE